MKYLLALDISPLNPRDPNLETALRPWNDPLLPLGTQVLIDCGESECHMTTVAGHDVSLKPIDKTDDEQVEISLEFTEQELNLLRPQPLHNASRQARAEAQVAFLLGPGGWKLLS